MSLLEFINVQFSYSQIPVLQNLSFQICPGEIVGFLGVNGAGKTTSFLLASGLLKAERGLVKILKMDPTQGKAWTHSVGVVMSGAGLYPRLTVKRNLLFFADLYGGKFDIDHHLEVHGLGEYSKKPAGQLSQGYRRRLALARATLHSPKLLLLDEPADGLDPAGTDHLHRYLRRFRDAGGGVVFTSHRLEEVEQLCDRILMLNEGAIGVEGTPEELSAQVGGGGLRRLLLELSKPGFA